MTAQGKRPSILVVDDDEGIRTMLQLALSERGYAVDAIADPREAWIGRPAVVVLDAQLGAETASDFLAAADLDDVPVVLITGAQDAERIGSDLRVAGVVRKPFDLDVLCKAVDAALASVVAPR